MIAAIPFYNPTYFKLTLLTGNDRWLLLEQGNIYNAISIESDEWSLIAVIDAVAAADIIRKSLEPRSD